MMDTKDIIIDNHGRKCILIKRNETPPQEWLNVQTDKRVHEPNLIFWQAFPLTGGAVSVPIKYCKYLRQATKEDIDIALQNANAFAKEVLNQLEGGKNMEKNKKCVNVIKHVVGSLFFAALLIFLTYLLYTL